MLLRNTGFILISVFLAPFSTAQEIGQRQEVAITAPAGMSTAAAPWLNVVPEKRQYYVYKAYTTPDIATQLDKPIVSPAYRSLLSKRATAFRSGSRSLRLTIDPTAIVDVGAERPGITNTAALVDLGRSPALLALLRSELRIDDTRNYVIPTLTTVIAPEDEKASAFAAHDTLTVTVAAMDHSRVTVWQFEGGKWLRMSDLTPAMVPTLDPQAYLKKLQMRRGQVYYQGYERVAPTQVGTIAPTMRDETMEHILEIMRSAQAQRTDAATQAKLAALQTAEAQKAAEKAAAAQANKPAIYTAYGNTPWCRDHCSPGTCAACCGIAAAAEHTTVHTLAFACHMSSDLCPWCHIGCAIMTAAMSTSIATMDTACVIGCTQGYSKTAAQGNPQHCPVH